MNRCTSALPHTLVRLISIMGMMVSGAVGEAAAGAEADNAEVGFRVEGTVAIAPVSAVDSDLNDPNARYAPNDTSGSAQPIPNPAVLGGYLNRPGAGATGRSFENGDLVDFFSVNLLAGQSIRLGIADHPAADLDLLLFGAGPPVEVVASSVGTSAEESVTVLEDGDYYVAVYAYAGASSYGLTVGGSLTPASPAALRLESDFRPGEIVIRPTAESPVPKGSQMSMKGVPWKAVAGEPHREMLLRIDIAAAAPRRKAATPPPDAISRLLESRQFRARWRTVEAVKALRQRPDVAFAEPNYRRRAYAAPNDELYPLQWHYRNMGLEQAWQVSTGNDAVVAVLDTGVLTAHPDLQGQLLPGYDFISEAANGNDGDGIDPDPEDTGDHTQPDGTSSFHGTHVAGTIAAATNNGIGVAGIAWNARIMPLRILGAEGATLYDELQALRYAGGMENDSGRIPPQTADIINMSYGGFDGSQAEQALLLELRSRGVILVAAAGNESSDMPSYPASFDGVVSVTAVDLRNEAAPYSNFGPFIDVAAPGGDTSADIDGNGHLDGVLSTVGDDSNQSVEMNYQWFQGTSMAAPHVAGVAALMKGVHRGLTPERFDELLSGGNLTDDAGVAGRDDRFGHGIISAYKAVYAAGVDGPAPQPFITVTPGSLHLGAGENETTLELETAGAEPPTVTEVAVDAEWLSVTPLQTDDRGAGTYRVSVSRSALAPGAYEGNIAFISTANTVDVTVLISVLDDALAADAGRHYVILVSPESTATLYQQAAEAVDGRYAFAFSDVAPGEYLLFAGTDFDNDGIICDAGEACGAFPTLTTPRHIAVEEDIAGLDFSSGIRVQLGGKQPEQAPFSRDGLILRRLR